MSKHPTRHGILFVLSAPSGTGKTTLLQAVTPTANLAFSVSCTTRPPRPGERDGLDYHFLDPARFQQQIATNAFLEYAQVHNHLYGTPLAPVLHQLRRGHDIILDVDTQGAAHIRASPHPEIQAALCDIFLMPPDLETLRQRLLGRGTESTEQLHLRLHNAAIELRDWHHYQYTILSGSRDEDRSRFLAIITAERCNTRRLHLPHLSPP